MNNLRPLVAGQALLLATAKPLKEGKSMRHLFKCMLVLAVIFLPSLLRAQARLTVLDQFLPSHSYAAASDINNIGTVCGDIALTDGSTRGYVLFANRTFRLLQPASGYNSSSANAIASDGMVVGISSNGSVTVPTLWKPNGTPLQLSSKLGVALDIASRKVLVKFYGAYMEPTEYHLYSYPDAVWTKIGTGALGLGIAGSSLSSDGKKVAGTAAIGNASAACRWESSSTLIFTGSESTVASAIDQNNVVGASGGPNYSGAMLWRKNEPIQLGSLPADWASFAHGINRLGTIVGESGTPAGRGVTPCYWRSYSPGAIALPTNGLQGAAKQINANGQAVGYLSDGKTRFAALWENVL